MFALSWLAYSAAGRLTALPSKVNVGCEVEITPDNAIGRTLLPGCKSGPKSNIDIDICGGTCFNHALIRHIEAFYAQNTWKLVSFKSRAKEGEDEVELKAWYIPPSEKTKGSGLAPRVVVQHGKDQNANGFEAQVAAFMLASAGFGVIVPSFRDHQCLTPNAKRKMTWSWDYPQDTLGAWDFARNDPNGEMGGALPADQVGLMGFSMGGYLVMSAFGMNGEIPAVWADTPVYYMRDELENLIDPPILRPVVTPIAWFMAYLKDHKRHYYNPEEKLSSALAKGRKVMIHYNPLDTTTPKSQTKKYLDLFKKYPERYPPVDGRPWVKEVTCNKETHIVTMLKHPSLYREALCTFFGGAFGQDIARCTNGTIPAIRPPVVVE